MLLPRAAGARFAAGPAVASRHAGLVPARRAYAWRDRSTRRGILATGLPLAIACGALACGGEPSNTNDPPPSNPPTVPTPPPEPPRFVLGTPGPWPVENVRYGSADGLLETADRRDDDGRGAEPLGRDGARAVPPPARRDELHAVRRGRRAPPRRGERPTNPVRSGWAKYCDKRPDRGRRAVQLGVALGRRDGRGHPHDRGRRGGRGVRRLQRRPHARHRLPGPRRRRSRTRATRCATAARSTGCASRADGTIDVVRFDLVSNLMGAKYWHDRTMNRLAYDHFVNPGTLYSAAGHGVTVLFPARYRPPAPGEWFDLAYSEYMGDHLHARVCFGAPCPAEGTGNQRMGDWLGLDLDAEGRLWTAGKWTAGPDHLVGRPRSVGRSERRRVRRGLRRSVPRPGQRQRAGVRGGAGRRPRPPHRRLGVPGRPRLVREPRSGDRPGGGGRARGRGVGSDPVPDLHRGCRSGSARARSGICVCLPDGRLVVAGFSTGLSVFDPASGAATPIRASGGLIPSDRILQLELDRMTVPATLHVATAGGAAAIRVVP